MAQPENYDVRDQRHLSIDSFRVAVDYDYPPRDRSQKPRRGDHAAHAASLLGQLAAALGAQPQPGADIRLPVAGLKPGTVVELTTLPPTPRAVAVRVPAAIESVSTGIVILRSKRNQERTESALLFVPDDARQPLAERIAEYIREPGEGRRRHLERFEVIETVKASEVAALFAGRFDADAPEAAWWELWVRGSTHGLPGAVGTAARNAGLDVHADRLEFPETTVLFVHASARDLIGFVGRVRGASAKFAVRPARSNPFSKSVPPESTSTIGSRICRRGFGARRRTCRSCACSIRASPGRIRSWPLGFGAPGPTTTRGVQTTRRAPGAMERRWRDWPCTATSTRS